MQFNDKTAILLNIVHDPSLSDGAAVVLDGEADVDHLAEARVHAARVREADSLRSTAHLE